MMDKIKNKNRKNTAKQDNSEDNPFKRSDVAYIIHKIKSKILVV